MTATRFALERAWTRIRALPLDVQVALWLLLVVVLAGPTFLLLFVPVAAALWLWETSRTTRTDLWRWARHLFQMIVAMYVGMLVYHLLIRAPVVALGFAGFVSGDLGYAWMNIAMVVGMVALMRVQGHDWRMSVEMSFGMVAPVAVCLALVRLGICPLVPFLSWLSESNVYFVASQAMLLGMIGVMVYRRGMYAQSMNPHAHHMQMSHA